jgi:predicted AAA+ superfamily ATPase
MRRDIYQELTGWKNSNNRRPLLVRGARQTGKNYIINELGNQEFRNLTYLNFERNPEYKDIFQTNNPIEIVEKISLYTAKNTKPG